jgi:hypothetical protein
MASRGGKFIAWEIRNNPRLCSIRVHHPNCPFIFKAVEITPADLLVKLYLPLVR